MVRDSHHPGQLIVMLMGNVIACNSDWQLLPTVTHQMSVLCHQGMCTMQAYSIRSEIIGSRPCATLPIG